MQVVFRTDASSQIGTGHVMRCLTLADKLQWKGAFVQFVCREHPGNLCDLIQQQGFVVHRLPYSTQELNHANEQSSYERWLGEIWDKDADQTSNILRRTCTLIDLMIVDHYGIDIRWEKRLRSVASKMMIIDDLANRAHDCDILLDQNLYEHMEMRYDGIVPEHCLKLIGPQYALLREEFLAARAYAKIKNGAIRRIFVFFGGSDPTNETVKALKALMLLNRTDMIVDVVVGRSNPRKEQIEVLCSRMPNTNFYCQINHIAELMMKADMAIGAGGSSTWERCSLGLPAITVTTADNQVEVTQAVAKAGAILYLGHYRDISSQSIAEALKQLLQSPESVTRMSYTGMELMGKVQTGGADSVAEILLAEKNTG